MTKICLDLCCGLGGFSSAFKLDPDWKVITLDVDSKFNPSVVADITKIDWLEFKATTLEGKSPDVLLASPPCNHFTTACPQFPRKGIKKALEIVGACLEAVVYLKPNKWLIENPRGRLRTFLGKPPQTIRYSDYDSSYPRMKTTDFWGNIFLPMVKHERRIPLNSGFKGSNNILRLKFNFPNDPALSAERAKIPLAVSVAVKEGVEASCLLVKRCEP